jgi:hypothetical protein
MKKQSAEAQQLEAQILEDDLLGLLWMPPLGPHTGPRWPHSGKKISAEAQLELRLAKLGLTMVPLPPALVSFLTEQVSTHFDNWKQVIIGLVESDHIPLDRATRLFIANELRRKYFPSPPLSSYEKRQGLADAIKWHKRYMQKHGAKAGEAERIIAGDLNLTVDTLRQKVKRANRERINKSKKAAARRTAKMGQKS